MQLVAMQRLVEVAPLAGAWIEIPYIKALSLFSLVAPLAGAWIEIMQLPTIAALVAVAPLAGAWIEISLGRADLVRRAMSLPSRERGLKYRQSQNMMILTLSLPSRERGLKFFYFDWLFHIFYVAPLAGAWIEIRDGRGRVGR